MPENALRAYLDERAPGAVYYTLMNYVIIFFADYLIYIAFIYAMLHIYFLHERRHHIRHVVTVAGSAVIAWFISHLLKDIIAHPRPDLSVALIVPDSLYSFPSGHATFMFALAATMYAYDKGAGRILTALAVIVGIFRVVGGVHYWYDIVAGAFVGYLVSLIVVNVFTALIKRR